MLALQVALAHHKKLITVHDVKQKHTHLTSVLHVH